MNKKVSKIIYIILLVILIPILLINMVIMIKSFVNKDEVPSVFGLKPMIVLTGSMEPEISKGDLVLAKNVNPDDLKVKDIISYRDNEDSIITHRIVSINTEGERYFTTKGDANNTNDSTEIKDNMIEGIYVCKIKGLGNVLQFIQTPVGIAIVVMFIIIVAFVLISISGGLKPSEDEELMEEFKEYKKAKKKKHDDR